MLPNLDRLIPGTSRGCVPCDARLPDIERNPEKSPVNWEESDRTCGVCLEDVTKESPSTQKWTGDGPQWVQVCEFRHVMHKTCLRRQLTVCENSYAKTCSECRRPVLRTAFESVGVPYSYGQNSRKRPADRVRRLNPEEQRNVPSLVVRHSAAQDAANTMQWDTEQGEWVLLDSQSGRVA